MTVSFAGTSVVSSTDGTGTNTVSRAVAGLAPAVTQQNTKSGLFSNTAAVAGVFTAVGVVVIAALLITVFIVVNQKKKRQQTDPQREPLIEEPYQEMQDK